MYFVLPDRFPHCCAVFGHGSEAVVQRYGAHSSPSNPDTTLDPNILRASDLATSPGSPSSVVKLLRRGGRDVVGPNVQPSEAGAVWKQEFTDAMRKHWFIFPCSLGSRTHCVTHFFHQLR